MVLTTTIPTNSPTGIPTAYPTHFNLLRIGIEYYISNSFEMPIEQDRRDFIPVVIGILIVTLCTLVHSAYINQNKFRQVRIIVDTCCVGVLLGCVCHILSIYTNDITSIILFNIGFITISPYIVQIADNLIFFYVYECISGKTSRIIRYILFIYFILILTCSWMFPFTIAPFWFNTNSIEYTNTIGYGLNLIYVIGAFLYNFAFSITYIRVLFIELTMNTQRTISNSHRIFAVKCILHFFSSTIMSILVTYSIDFAYQVL
jgi:hypothetical protein